MPSIRIHTDLKDQIYFFTFTVKNWYYLFDRHDRFQILEDSFVFCQKYKSLRVYAYVFMLNHLHCIASAPDLSSVIHDMKAYLSKALRKNMSATEKNVVALFHESDGTFGLWQKTNYPKLVMSEEFLQQKVNYIHFNPVKKQYVHFPEDWRWSSASKIPGKIVLSDIAGYEK